MYEPEQQFGSAPDWKSITLYVLNSNWDENVHG